MKNILDIFKNIINPKCQHKYQIIGQPLIGGTNYYKCFYCGHTYSAGPARPTFKKEK